MASPPQRKPPGRHRPTSTLLYPARPSTYPLPKSRTRNQNPTPAPPFPLSPLGNLPLELRHQIYALVLTVPGPVSIRQSEQRTSRKHPLPHACLPITRLALLAASTHLYAEALPLFYTRNTLLLAGTRALHAFLTAIGPVRRRYITSLHISRTGPSSLHASNMSFALLAGSRRLERFTWEADGWGWAHPSDKRFKSLARLRGLTGVEFLFPPRREGGLRGLMMGGKGVDDGGKEGRRGGGGRGGWEGGGCEGEGEEKEGEGVG